MKAVDGLYCYIDTESRDLTYTERRRTHLEIIIRSSCALRKSWWYSVSQRICLFIPGPDAEALPALLANMGKFYGLRGTQLNIAIAVVAGTDFALFGYGKHINICVVSIFPH
jgi:hypothetical protein